MHPPLASHLHDDCSGFIDSLNKCHEEHPYWKFFGKCNDAKLKLMKCFEEERARRRKENGKVAAENAEKTRKFRESVNSSK